MFTSFIVNVFLFFNFKEEVAMLVRLYASEIILEKITIERVPSKLRGKVEEYLKDVGYIV